jgi:MFS transporter, FHS family, glucose/mannose:H+ symporter
MPPSEISRAPSVSSLNKAASAAFLPIGFVTVVLGPLLPTLSARWSLNYAQAGSLFTAQFLGATVGVCLSGVTVSRWGFRFAINAGLLAIAAGLSMLPFSSRSAGLICIFAYGAGIGLAIPAANLLVAAINPERRSAALNLLNFSWSAGAVVCPFAIAEAAKVHEIQRLLVGVAALLVLVLIGIAGMPSFIEPALVGPAHVEPARVRHEGGSGGWSILGRKRSIFVLAALFFLYVGTENAFGGWIASFAKGLGASSTTLAVATPSFFYAALMIGRWAAPLVLRRRDEISTVRAGLAVACMGIAGLALSRSLLLVVTSVSIAGLGLATVYPITISLLSREFGTAAARVGSVMFTMANLGGAILPWIVGYSSHRFNSLGVGLTIPLATTVLMCILYALNFGRGRALQGPT